MTGKLCLALVLLFPLPDAALPAGQGFTPLGRAALEELATRQFQKFQSRFTPEMAAALPRTRLAELWENLIGELGPFESITQARTEELQGYHIVILGCKFAKGDLQVRITFDAEKRVAGLRIVPGQPEAPWNPPPYAKLNAFRDEEITVESGEWQLPGTLSLPAGKGPFPAIVLVQGSGPHDQDETVGANKPFKDLAYGLASRNIAVLRYTKRTLKYGDRIAENISGFTVKEETIDDARAAVALLASTPEIDSRRIYILGHSLGAMLAPRIAQGDRRVAGIIIMAGNSRPMEDLIVEQIKYLAGLAGKPTDPTNPHVHQAEQAVREIQSPALAPDQIVDVMGIATPGSYWLDLRNYHPAEVAAHLTIPILVFQAARDYQVRLQDFEGWKKALAGHPKATFKLYPELNHLFMVSQTLGTGLGTPADYQKPGHVSEPVIIDIANWINTAQAGSK